MTPLRILFAIHGAPDPNTAVYANVCHRAEFLRRAGHAVEVLTPHELGTASLARLDPLLLPIALARRGLARYDVVVFHSYLGWAYHALRPLVDPGRRAATVIVFHGLEPLYRRAVADEARRAGTRISARFRLLHHHVVPSLLKYACRASDRVLCLNQAERRFLVEAGWAQPSRVEVVANGVEPDLVVPRTCRGRATSVLFVGQWLQAKGTRSLVESFSRLAARWPDLRLVCAGVKASEPRVRSDFPDAIRARVTVYPEVTRQELADVLRAADVFVFPSVYEGFGNAVVEAMSAALPIVTTRVGAGADLLEHERSVLFVDVGDVDGLTSQIERLIDDPAQRQRLGEAARQRAGECSWDRVNDVFARNLLEAVEDHRAALARDLNGSPRHVG